MARPKSVILSKEEKKQAVVDLKAKLKAAKDNVKQIEGVRKEADKALTAAQKAHVATFKKTDKELTGAQKIVTGLEAQLAALTGAAETAQA